jgi:hypothetical protein
MRELISTSNLNIDSMINTNPQTHQPSVSLDHFKIIDRSLGRGTYGDVKLVEKDGKRYAMKKLLKDDIVKVSFGQEKFVAMSFNL